VARDDQEVRVVRIDQARLDAAARDQAERDARAADQARRERERRERQQAAPDGYRDQAALTLQTLP
jgi:hypothetical protein